MGGDEAEPSTTSNSSPRHSENSEDVVLEIIEGQVTQLEQQASLVQYEEAHGHDESQQQGAVTETSDGDKQDPTNAETKIIVPSDGSNDEELVMDVDTTNNKDDSNNKGKTNKNDDDDDGKKKKSHWDGNDGLLEDILDAREEYPSEDSHAPGAHSMRGAARMIQRRRRDASQDPIPNTDDEPPSEEPFLAADIVDEEELEADLKERIMKDIVEATEVQRDEPSFFQKYKILFIVFILAAITISVVLGVLLNDGDNTQFPSPTLSQEEVLRQLVLPISSEESLEDETSAQFKAFQWLFLEDQREDLLNVRDSEATPYLLERYVMAVLYFSTGGPDWADDLRFLSNYSICEWPNIGEIEEGASTNNEVDCDENGQVVKIRIDVNNMNGTIPSELQGLSALEVLSLGRNSLYGTMPPELGKISTLSFLQFASNGLTGTIPSSIQRLTNMEIISFYHNQLTGPMPQFFGNTWDLEVIDFARNQLTGTIPGFNTQSKIRAIYLEDNHLEGTIPASTFTLPLQGLSLSGNNLNGTLGQSLRALDKVRFMNLHDNDLSGSLPSEFGKLADVGDLTLNGNSFTGSIPSEFGMLRDIGNLDLSRNRLAGELPSELGNLVTVRSLSVAHNPGIVGTIPEDFDDLLNLQNLKLQNTSLSGGLNEAFCNSNIILTSIEADCGGLTPEISCPCCTTCCADGSDCEISVPAICEVRAGKFEQDTDRGATCLCSEDGTTVTCTDTACESCNIEEDVCVVNTNYGYTLNGTTGEVESFTNTLIHTQGWNGTEIRFEDTNEGLCQLWLDGEECRNCGRLTCQSDFVGYAFNCDNLEGGPNFNSCDEFTSPGLLEIFFSFSPAELKGCPLLIESV